MHPHPDQPYAPSRAPLVTYIKHAQQQRLDLRVVRLLIGYGARVAFSRGRGNDRDPFSLLLTLLSRQCPSVSASLSIERALDRVALPGCLRLSSRLHRGLCRTGREAPRRTPSPGHVSPFVEEHRSSTDPHASLPFLDAAAHRSRSHSPPTGDVSAEIFTLSVNA